MLSFVKSLGEAAKNELENFTKNHINSEEKFLGVLDTSKIIQKIHGCIYINPQLLTIEYPTPNNINHISNTLNKLHQNHYILLNLSEKPYSSSPFLGKLLHIPCHALPYVPFDKLLTLLPSLHSFLQSSPSNVLVTHCVGDRTRTLCFLASYLLWSGQALSVEKALHQVSQAMDIPLRHIHPSQKLFLGLFFRVLKGGRVPLESVVRLKKLILRFLPDYGVEERGYGEEYVSGDVSLLPGLSSVYVGREEERGERGERGFLPVVEVLQNGKRVFQAFKRGMGRGLREEIAAFGRGGEGGKQEEVPLGEYDLFEEECLLSCPDLELTSDFIIRVKNVLLKRGERGERSERGERGEGEVERVETVMRLCMHPMVLEEHEEGFLQCKKSEVDGAYSDSRVPENFVIDVIYDAHGTSSTGEELWRKFLAGHVLLSGEEREKEREKEERERREREEKEREERERGEKEPGKETGHFFLSRPSFSSFASTANQLLSKIDSAVSANVEMLQGKTGGDEGGEGEIEQGEEGRPLGHQLLNFLSEGIKEKIAPPGGSLMQMGTQLIASLQNPLNLSAERGERGERGEREEREERGEKGRREEKKKEVQVYQFDDADSRGVTPSARGEGEERREREREKQQQDPLSFLMDDDDLDADLAAFFVKNKDAPPVDSEIANMKEDDFMKMLSESLDKTDI